MRHQQAEIDRRYQELRQSPVAVDYAGRSFENFDLREFLTQCLARLRFSSPRPRALEYGTGTGPGACFLAARGFCVEAIDRSPTAIEMARRYATERRLDIHYEVEDICQFAGTDRTYDLVVDSFCLHRIITDADRRRAMSNVRRMLKTDGYYILGSVVYRAERDFGKDYFDPATGIVYGALAGPTSDDGEAVRINGRRCYARHRHVTPQHLRGELEAAGFQIFEQIGSGGLVLCSLAATDT